MFLSQTQTSPELSRSLFPNPLDRKAFLPEHVTDSLCPCSLCVSDTKPPAQPKPSRETSSKQETLSEIEAYGIIVNSLAHSVFEGKLAVPDTYFVNESRLVYSSRRRLKVRLNQTNLEVKKHFEERRRKNREEHELRQKEVALLTYNDCAQQILTDALLSKILDRRKNDPFWDDIHRISLLPPELKSLTLDKYTYERTPTAKEEMEATIIKVAAAIDFQEQKGQQDHSLIPSFVTEEEYPPTPFDSQSVLDFENQSLMSTFLGKSKTKKMAQSMISLGAREMEAWKELQMKTISQSIIAFLQLVHHIRVLKVKLQFFTDGRTLFLARATDFVGLRNIQLKIIHDRYQPLEQIHTEQLVEAKLGLQLREEQELWRVCTSVVNDCLQYRRVELRLKSHKHPSFDALKQIFLRILPNFSSERIFKNSNWKNELKQEMEDVRAQINKTIREDEGIRILKRFGIHFHRTFETSKKP